MTTLNIVSIIMFVLLFLSISYIFFVVSFIKKNNNKLEKIQLKINELMSFDFDIYSEKFYSIINDDEKYNVPSEILSEFKELFIEKLRFLKGECETIYKINKKFEIFKCQKEIKELKNKIDQLEKNFKNYLINTEVFIENNVLKIKIIIKLIGYINSLRKFYEKYLVDKYSSYEIFSIFENIKSNMEYIASKYKDLNDPRDMALYFDEVFNNINLICRILSELYVYNEIEKSINFNIKEITTTIYSGNIKLSSIDSTFIERKIFELNKLHQEMKSDLSSVKLSRIKKIIIEAYNNIELIKEKIQYSIKHDFYINDKIKPILKYININFKTYLQILLDIQNCFNNLSDININKDIEKIQKIFLSFKKYIKLFSSINSEYLTSNQKEEICNEFNLAILNLSNLFESIIFDTKYYHSNFSKLIKEISMCKKTIALLYHSILSVNKDESKDEFIFRISILNDIEAKLYSNFINNKTNEIQNSLIEIKSWIITIHLKYVKDFFYKKASENILKYSYKYICDEKFLDKINECESLYKKEEYRKVVLLLEQEIKTYKRKYDKG